MKNIELSLSFLKPYFDGREVRAGKKKTEDLYKDLKVHADGEYPEKLIDERRPNESDKIKDYRKKVYKAITKSPVQRVLTSLTKIRRSVDWGIIHPVEKYPNAVADTEKLSHYTEHAFPMAESFENWLFSVCFKNYALDANGAILWMPINRETKDTEYLQPVPIIFNSPDVLEYIPEKLLIVSMESKTEGTKEYNVKRTLSWLVADDKMIQKWKRTSDSFEMEWEWKHEIGTLPAFLLGGAYRENVGTHIIRESRLSPMIERLDEAAREYSDMQAEVVQHMHSERWQWATQKCSKCANDQGIPQGFINDDKQKRKITCPACGGNKSVSASPYNTLVVRPSRENMGEQAAPIPPAGYITKETKIVEIQDDRIDEHVHKALAAINMQFLDITPLNESGKAKEVDRDELNNFVHGVAQDLVRIAKYSMRLMLLYRYRVIIKDEKKRLELMPDIRVPQKFDLLSSSYLADEIEKARNSGMNPEIIGALEREYAAKKFYNEPAVRNLLTLILDLDPLASISEEDKMIRKANKGITELDYIVSSNITELVRDAMEDATFITSKREEKLKKLRELAAEKKKEINSSRVELPPVDEPEPEE
jgi:hypothetical protein